MANISKRPLEIEQNGRGRLKGKSSDLSRL